MGEHNLASRLAVDGRGLLRAARGNLDAPVAGCGDWFVRDLVTHMSRIHNRVAVVLSRRATEVVPDSELPDLPDGADEDALMGHASAALDALLTAFGEVDPAEAVWTWTARRDAAFWFRRLWHETAVHRWDAETAAGRDFAIDGDQGADGIDELFEVLAPAMLARGRTLPAGSLHLHRTDGPGEWMLTGAGGAVSVEHVHAKGDAALRGPGGSLYLAMWGRVPLSELEMFGDEAVAQSWINFSP